MNKKNKLVVCFLMILCFFILILNFLPIINAASPLGDINTISEQSGLPKSSVSAVLGKALSWLLGIFGVISIIALVISGIMYITASGDTNQIEKAKSAMKWSIIGIIIGLSGYIIIQTINTLLGGA